ncbi:hypothetical protein FACS189454_01640 [Planctomycetales bacterium]|nr:hypothetical protein FACS189454_01640 [Planctomycetales bacterium]
MLLKAKTIESDIRLTTVVDGKEYTAQGRYEEQALAKPLAGVFFRSMYRLEVNFLMNSQSAGSDPNRMTMICHIDENDPQKNQISKFVSIEGNKQFSTIRLAALEKKIKASKTGMMFVQVNEVRNLGGLAATLRQVTRFYEFKTQPVQDNLAGDEPITAIKLTGSLNSVYYKDMLGRFGGLDKKGHNPANLPTDIEIWLGRVNDFPYQIRYLNRRNQDKETKTVIFQERYFNTILNGETIPLLKFAPLTPPEGVFTVQDETENFIRSLGL